MNAQMSGVALELNQIPNKEGKVYPKLVFFEPDQKYPQLKIISVKPEQVSEVTSIIGKRVTVLASIFEYDGRINLNYLSSK